MTLDQVGLRPAGLRQLGDPNAAPTPLGGEVALRRLDTYWMAGMTRSFGTPNFSVGNGTDTFLIAIPEFFPTAGSITTLSCYGSQTGISDPRWMGVFSDVNAGGANEHFPGNSINNFVVGDSPAGPNITRHDKAVSIAVAANTILWFVCQKAAVGNIGLVNIDNWMRPSLGIMVPASMASGGGESKGGYCGIRTNAPVTYNSALATFPTANTELIQGATNTWGVDGAHSSIPAMFFKFDPTV